MTLSTNGLMAAAGEVTKELKKTKSGLRILARLDSHSSPFLLDEPHWIPDNEVCDSNKTVLDVFFRVFNALSPQIIGSFDAICGC